MKIILLLVGLILMGTISAQMAGGGAPALIQQIKCSQFDYCKNLGEDYYCNNLTNECTSDFVECLKINCNFFCKEEEMDKGNFYKEDKCWCEKYEDTSHGRIIDRDGWIQIKECHIKADYKSENRTLFYFVIFILCLLIIGICLGMYFKELLIKNKRGFK